MEYFKLLEELRSLADEKYRSFHARLLDDPSIKLFGVRMPVMRKLAKKYKGELEKLLQFPDEFYEVTLLKCLTLGLQPYDVYSAHLQEVLPLIDNWATCDCFDAPCIKKNRAAFLEIITNIRFSEHEFTSRYALVQLLKYYCEEEYLPVIFESAEGCDHTKYYVSMAAAWLVAEVLVKFYAAGVAFIKKGTMPAVTHNRAIRKARESFRLTAEQKEELNALKRRKGE